MTTTAKSVLTRVAETLADENSVRWSVAELCRYFNDGQNAIRELNPDATSVTTTMALVAGARQALPAQAAMLLDIIGNTDGASIRQCGRKALDAQVPNWQQATASTTIRHFMFDDRDETEFYVYPPAAAGASLEVRYSAYPTPISDGYTLASTVADVTGNMALPDKYANALREYVLSRAFDKDGEHPANAARSVKHYSAFLSALGMGAQAQAANNPRPITAKAALDANP